MKIARILIVLLVGVMSAGMAMAEERWKTLPEPPPMPQAVETGASIINGIQMYYAIYGKGDPVLLIHGGLGNADVWSNQVNAFAKTHKVIVADSRGHGRSSRDDRPFGYDLMADDYLALLDFLKIDKVALVGWSDGGINGLLLAIRHPDKVKKLAVTGANLWPDSTAVNPVGYKWALQMNKDLEAKSNKTPEEKNDLKVIHLLSYEPHITLQQLSTIKCPSLIISGDHDVILPEHTLLIARNIPQSYAWILPNSGHSTPIFYKDEFNKKVDEFFSKPYRTFEGLSILQ